MEMATGEPDLGIGAWLGVALSAALASGGFLLSQEAAGAGRKVPSP